MVLTGLAYNAWMGGWEGLGVGLAGMAGAGLSLALVQRRGHGPGDVKLMAGIGGLVGRFHHIFGLLCLGHHGHSDGRMDGLAAQKLRASLRSYF